MGILKQKQQVAKQKKMIGDGAITEPSVSVKREYENPKGNSYTFFSRSGKRICDMTNCREDGDGYRLLGRPNSGEVDHVYTGDSSWGFKRFMRSFNKTKIMKK